MEQRQQKQEKNTKKQIVFYLIPVIIFLAFLSYVLIRTIPGEVMDTFAETEVSVAGVESLSDNFEDVLQENIYGRYDYINLNGLSTRVLGINSLNERQKLANGQLAFFTSVKDVSVTSENLIELNDFLAEREIDLVYIQAPRKTSLYNVEFSPGYSGTSKQSFDAMAKIVEEAGIATINMDTWFEENGWTMEEVYFKTDHHWTPRVGLTVANLTMQLLLEQGSIEDYNANQLEEYSYTIETLENWFLGAHGKRVGIYYAGIDDIDVYYPNFETNYAISQLHSGSTNWDYSDSLLYLDYIESKDLFETNAYDIYLYGSYPIQVIRNTEAKNTERVLVTGDSYRQVLQYFLASQFQEMYYIDMRYYTDGTFAQYVEEIQPDIVILCSSSCTDTDIYNFGVEEYIADLDSTQDDNTVVEIQMDAVIEAQADNDNNFVLLCDDLDPNQAYTLTLDSTSYSGGEDLYVQMTLQDLSTGQAVCNRYFDANSEETQKWIFSVPEDDDNYAIYLYAGTKGHTANVSVEVNNIRLQKGIQED